MQNMLHYILEECTKKRFLEGLKSPGYFIGDKMSSVETTAMWTHSITNQLNKQRTPVSYIVVKYGTSLFCSKILIDESI